MNIEQVAKLASETLDRNELEVWIMKITGHSFRAIRGLYQQEHAAGRREDPAPSLSKLHATFHRAEAKLQAARPTKEPAA